ncbi:MAG: 4Fe-4S dicluster domain-containing protein [Firmicutes bacterium]|nr:4Fe-4S dicluster domain-containing protein [Bacillota bacterium]
MKLTRRRFLKLSGLTALALTSSDLLEIDPLVEAGAKRGKEPAGMLIDITQCIGCGMCEHACRTKNNPDWVDEPVGGLSPTSWTYLRTVSLGEETPVAQGAEDSSTRFVRNQCFHCQDPACASACPVAALHKTPEAPVIYRAERCIGCRYCMVACPFGIPRYEWDRALPSVTKCSFCFDLVRAGEEPACSAACPTGASRFGKRNDLLEEARGRIAGAPDRYIDHIFGQREVGGTSFLFLSDVPFAKLGFRTGVPTVPMPAYTWQVMSKIPGAAAGMGLFLGAAFLYSNRSSRDRAAHQQESRKEAHL